MTPPNTAGVSCANPSSSYSTFYQYNGQGLRTEELSPGRPMEYFTYNVESAVPQLLMDGSNAYIYGPQGTALGTAPVEQISLSAPNSQSSVTYLVSDPQGVRLTFNSSGTITAGASYDAYGQVTSGGLSNVTPFGYAGGYTDPTGLIYLINRYYDPSTGQFLSVDPLVGITDQPYQYAGGDPVNFIDPLGLCSWYNLYCSVVQPIIHSPVYTWFNKNLNPAYMALMGYYNEAQAAENGCSFWTVAKYGAEGVLGVVGTIMTAYAGGEVAGFIETPDTTWEIGNRGFHLHYDEIPHEDIGSHLQIDTWQKGIPGSGQSWRFPRQPW